MDLSNTALVNNIGNSQTGSVQSAAQITVLRMAIDLQSEDALELLASMPAQPALASSGNLGTQLNVYA
jgi:Putative motility protein